MELEEAAATYISEPDRALGSTCKHRKHCPRLRLCPSTLHLNSSPFTQLSSIDFVDHVVAELASETHMRSPRRPLFGRARFLVKSMLPRSRTTVAECLPRNPARAECNRPRPSLRLVFTASAAAENG